MQIDCSGFLTICFVQDRTHTLKSFASSADWVKSLHFGDPKPTADPGVAAERSSKRRKLGSYTGPEPTIDEIEGEFWRVIEAPDDVRLMAQGLALCILLLTHSLYRGSLRRSQIHMSWCMGTRAEYRYSQCLAL